MDGQEEGHTEQYMGSVVNENCIICTDVVVSYRFRPHSTS